MYALPVRRFERRPRIVEITANKHSAVIEISSANAIGVCDIRRAALPLSEYYELI
jgi:hypothetical protein